MPPITKKPVNYPRPAGNDRDDGLTCEICGYRMVSRQCKIRCPNCGYTRDCSDP